jgi:hypothetical protein
MNTCERIKKAQRRHESGLIYRIREANLRGALFNFWYGHNMERTALAEDNALSRLEERGLIVRLPRQGRRCGGWKLAANRAPRNGWKTVDSQGRLPGDQWYTG